MKKKVLIGLIIIVLVILLFPRRNALNDGGTIEYKAEIIIPTKLIPIDCPSNKPLLKNI